MIYHDQPQMVDVPALSLRGADGELDWQPHVREVLGKAFAAIDREALIEKAARAMVSFPHRGITKRWLAESALVAAGILAPAPPSPEPSDQAAHETAPMHGTRRDDG